MKAEDIVKEIAKSEVSQVISQGFSQLYRQKPQFPVTYLAHWLKEYSAAKDRKKNLIDSKKQKSQRIQKLEKSNYVQKQKKQDDAQAAVAAIEIKNKQFEQALSKNQHLGDLLSEWLPEYIEKYNQLTGAYVGKLDFRKKALEEHNFEQGAENDTQNPKVISYIGCSKSQQKLLRGKFLPNQQGISYEVFNEQQEEAAEGEEEQGAIKPVKKDYKYVQNVLKQPRLFYFKYPRLGSYVCYPLRIKSYLSIATLDKGIADYREYLKNKQEAQNDYKQKLSEAKTQAEDAGKKAQDFQVLDDDPSTEEQKKVLVAEFEQLEQKVKQLEQNPPVIEQVVFDVVGKDYFLGCDTLGQDRSITAAELEEMDDKVKTFKQEWEEKQKAMLLKDILLFLEDENTLQNLQNQFQEHERNISSNFEASTKEQFQNRQKQGDFEYGIVRCQKLCALFSDPAFKNSMDVYLRYNVPKYCELIQIWCMLLGESKSQINLSETNCLDHRKIVTKQSIEKLIEKLNKYELRRDSSGECQEEYKISKLLQRIEKIDLETLTRYNGFLLLLANVLKAYCWARIFCRDARIEAHEAKIKAKEERQQEIAKWDQEYEKNLEAAKAEPVEEDQPPFNEQEWIKNYETENPKPLPLEVSEFQPHLDIQ